MKRTIILAICCLVTMGCLAQRNAIRSGEIWPDDKGVHINAHGGGVLKHGDTYYWFGEHKSATTSDALVGVTCYSSKDLVHWKDEGVGKIARIYPARLKIFTCKGTLNAKVTQYFNVQLFFPHLLQDCHIIAVLYRSVKVKNSIQTAFYQYISVFPPENQLK